MTENTDIYSNILQEHGIRATAVRVLIYKAMERFHDTFSIADIEDALETVDKSTIFRTLTLFVSRHVVHAIEDGSGSEKFCIVRPDDCGPDQMHCHFYCESCHKTICLHYTHIPIVGYPEGFELREVNYLMKGLCPDCARKKADNR